jgi:uncharacterized protein (DUF1015 family)
MPEEHDAPVVDVAPFRALRYDPAVAGAPASTSAPAYDDLERFTYAQHRTASPYTVLELLAEGAEADYAPAAAAYRRWRRTGVIVEDAEPALFRYDIHELRRGVPSVLRGVLAAVSVGDGLLAHERVNPDRVASRARRLAAVPVDLAPVFAVHAPARPELRQVLDAPPARPPLVALTDEAGADHRIWPLAAPHDVQAVVGALASVQAVIADGHHRYEAAGHLAGDGGDTRILAYLVDGSIHGPQLQAVHRLLRSVPDPVALLDRDFDAKPLSWGDVLAALGREDGILLGLRRGGASTLLRARDSDALRARLPAGTSDAWRSLDTAVWEHLVHPALGGEVEYHSNLRLAAAAADADPTAALFALRPPSLATVYACAAAGEVMPVKTTWFRPKPRAGLVMRSLQSGP